MNKMVDRVHSNTERFGEDISSSLLNEQDSFEVYAVAQWLRHCATNRKVAGSIPDRVTGFFSFT
jgi:hypothetical protein